MRTFAFFGGLTIAAAVFPAGSALAWTEEKPSPQQDQNSVMYSDPDAFKALQDKVNGKTQNQSGFYFYGGVNSGDNGGTDRNSYTDTNSNSFTGTNPYTSTNPYRVQPMTGSGSAFSYSPMPGFRGLPQ
jgi:hypothetical protein